MLTEIRPGVAAVVAATILACAIAIMVWNYAVHVRWSNGEFSMGPAPLQAASPPPESAKPTATELK